jgi:hypothetical protein
MPKVTEKKVVKKAVVKSTADKKPATKKASTTADKPAKKEAVVVIKKEDATDKVLKADELGM